MRPWVQLQLVVASASLLCSFGHVHTVYYQYAVRFLHQADCSNCMGWESECFQSMSQCASLGFHYFNVTVLNHNRNCTASVMLLLLELQQAEGKEDAVYLQPCINGMNKYHFWNYLACSTVTEGGGREADFVSCKPNEILFPDVTNPTTLPVWVPIVLAILAVMVVIALLLSICVAACKFNHNRTARANSQESTGGPPRADRRSYQPLDGTGASQSHPGGNVQERGPPKLDSESYQPLVHSDPAQSLHSRLSQWLKEKGLVRPNWFWPSARTSVDFERQQPQGASERNSTSSMKQSS